MVATAAAGSSWSHTRPSPPALLAVLGELSVGLFCEFCFWARSHSFLEGGSDLRSLWYISAWIHSRVYYPGMQTLTDSSVLARCGYALSDPTRARILLALGEAAAYPSDLAELIGVSRQSLSNHLACLRGCGLVVAAPEGRRVRYELADPRLGHVLTDLLSVVLAVDPAQCADSAAKGCC